MSEKEKKPKKVEKKNGSLLSVSRRDFLKGMGTSAVAATLTGSLPVVPEAEAAPPPGVKEAMIQMTVNEKLYRVKVKSHWTLLEVLRREMGLQYPLEILPKGEIRTSA